jgi:WD40 repeat protein
MKTSKDVLEVHRVTPPCDDHSEAVMSLSTSPDGAVLAASMSDGAVQFISEHLSVKFRPYGLGGTEVGLTCTKFGSQSRKVKELQGYNLLTTSTTGLLRCYNVVPGKVYEMAGTGTELGNELLVGEFTPDCMSIATGGADTKIRLYARREEELQLMQVFEQGIDNHGAPTLGHTSRIFAIRFVDANVFLSAGWESSMMLFDLRAGKHAVRPFDGPRISGDGIDFRGNLVVTASDRITDQIQVFDFASGKLVMQKTTNSKLYSTRITDRKNKLCAWFAGNEENMLQCLNLKTLEMVSEVTHIPESMFCVDVNPDDDSLVYGGGGAVSLYRIRVIE